jgi:hypothetical protein
MIMIVGLPMFTLIHVVICVIAMIAGLVVVGGMFANARLEGWTKLFLTTTVLVSVTGFGFPFTRVLPPHIVGALSLVILAVCIYARYAKRMEGSWRAVYVVTAVAALYLNVFVLVTQLFTKTPPIAQIASTPQDAPFAITQALVLLLFIWIGRMAVRAFQR